MTPEARAKRQARQREYMRRMRAAKKTAGSRLQPVSPVPAPMTSAKPENAHKSKPVKSSKPQSERARHREYRASLAEYLEDALTDPAAPMSGSEFERMRLASCWLGWFDKLDRLEASADGKPDVLAEMRLSIALECLRRLADMKPAAAPALPGIAQKSV